MVVGVGNIGHEVCQIGQALGMRVLGVDVDPRHADVEYTDIATALPQADVLVAAMDLNRATLGYFDAAKWRRIKPGAVFVNVSRGELSPSTTLLAALEAGQLAGVGLDVFDHEAQLATSLRTDTPTSDLEIAATLALADRDDCLLTPHNAFNTAEAVHRKSEHSVEQIVAFRESGKFLWPVPRVAGVEARPSPQQVCNWGLAALDPSHPPVQLSNGELNFAACAQAAGRHRGKNLRQS